MKPLACLLVLLISTTPSWAQTLTDPTRPPLSWLKQDGQSDNKETESLDIQWPTINAVIHKQGQFKALIEGQLFVEGQQWQGMNIIRIRPSEVVFAGPEGPVTRQVGSQNIKKEVAQNEM